MLKEISSTVALEQVVSIGNELNISLSECLSVEHFVNKIMDRIEGQRSHAEKMQFVVAYRQEFLMSDWN